MTTAQTTRTGHPPRCQCSVCWAHHFADALNMFPVTAQELAAFPPPPPDYYTFRDYTREFKREQRTSDRVGLDN